MLINKITEKKIIKITEEIDENNAKRIGEQVLPTGATISTYNYANDKNTYHEMNLYTPDGLKAPLPLIVYIHGGAWMSGDKDMCNNMCIRFSKHGYKVVSLNYRLCRYNHIDKQIQDIFACLEYVKNNGSKFAIDLNSVYIMGDSSGGMLTLFINAINQDKELQEIYGVKHIDLNIKAIEANHAVPFMKDLKVIPDHKVMNKLAVNAFFTLLCGSKKSPLYKYIDIRDYISKVKFPPIYCVSSTGDKAFSSQTVRLVPFLKEKGFDFESNILQNDKLDHVFNIIFPDTPEGIKTNEGIIAFFKKHQ